MKSLMQYRLARDKSDIERLSAMSLNFVGKFFGRSVTALSKLHTGFKLNVGSVRFITANSRSFELQRTFTRSSKWYMCANDSVGLGSTHLHPWSTNCNCCKLHTTGSIFVFHTAFISCLSGDK